MTTKSKHYLTNEQLEYFKSKLLHWKEELLKESQDVQQLLKSQESEPDLIDSACNLATQTIELRTKDRSRKLIHKIDMALKRIDNGTYGYCEETGEPIGLKRLEARPIATLCIEAQEQHEKKEKDFRDEDEEYDLPEDETK
ncbi:MAG: RNA polymerase-binding protein DksA [Alphaproteobacteria bacterium]|nr:RNA polymerase-binding protein DksA [Alphaproteobacteria bacterium]